MVFQKFENRNNAQSSLSSAISASAGTLVVNTGEGALFPTSNFPLTIETRDANKLVTTRELVYCTNRAGDIFSITRSWGDCVQDDTASTKVSNNTAHGFDTGASVSSYLTKEQLEDIQNELTRIVDVDVVGLEDSKLSIADYISGDKLFADSTNSTDSYEVTIAGITSYAQIDGQAIRVRVDVGNTADATLNINGLGAKDIVKFQGDPLMTGDVEAGQIIFVIYNGNSDDFEIKDSIDQAGQAVVDKFQKDVILGEDISAGDEKGLAYYGDGVGDTLLAEQTSTGTDVIVGNGISIKAREKITVPNASEFANIIRQKFLRVKKVGSPTDNLNFSLFESDGTTLITNLIQQPGSGLITSYSSINMLSTPVSSSVRDNPSAAGSYKNGTMGVRIQPTANCILSEAEFTYHFFYGGGSETVYLYNETDDINMWEWTGNVNSSFSIPNIVLVAGKIYQLRCTSSSPQDMNYGPKTFPIVYDNIDIISGIDGVTVDNTNIYGLQYITTQEITSPSPVQVDLSAYEGQDIYLQIERDTAQNATNYYHINGTSAGTSVETWDGIDWNDISVNLYSKTQRGFNFEEDKVWLFDARYDVSRRADGVIIESGLAGEVKTLVSGGNLLQNSAIVGGNYYGDSGVALIGSQTTIVDPTEYHQGNNADTKISRTLNDNQYIEKVTLDLSNSNSSNYAYARVWVNGVYIGYARKMGAYANFTIPVDMYLGYGDVISVDLEGGSTYTASMKNTTLYQQEYTGGRGQFVNSRPETYPVLSVGQGLNNNDIALTLNEQRFFTLSEGLTVVPGISYTMATAGTLHYTSSTSYIKFKSFKVDTIYGYKGMIVGPYVIRIGYTISESQYTVYGDIRINGVSIGERSINDGTLAVTKDVSVNVGDVIDIYCKVSNSSHSGYISSAFLKFDVEELFSYDSTVLLD